MVRTFFDITAITLWAWFISAWPQSADSQTASAPPPAAASESSDAALTQAVYAALKADPNYFFRHVNVRVDQGVANLSGYVDSGAAINRARTVAGKVPGITRVHTNNLKVDTQQRR